MQSGLVAAMQVLTTERTPKKLKVAHGNPEVPLFPSINDSAVEDPIKVAAAPKGTKPPAAVDMVFMMDNRS
jgi:hypothetical protein